MTLNRYEMAAVKRTAQNTKTLVKNKAKIEAKMRDLAGQILEMDNQINLWEQPLIDKWGFTSSQIIEMGGELPETVVAEEVESVPSFYAEA